MGLCAEGEIVYMSCEASCILCEVCMLCVEMLEFVGKILVMMGVVSES